MSKEPEKKVPHVRIVLERLMEEAKGVEDIDSLLGILEEMGGLLIHLQWLEQQLLPLITDARSHYNNANEEIKVSEDREVIRLNDSGVPINRAEKLARLSHAEMRATMNKFQEARNRYEDEYTDLRGFRTVVEGCKMTLHQKVSALKDEYRSRPYQKNKE